MVCKGGRVRGVGRLYRHVIYFTFCTTPLRRRFGARDELVESHSTTLWTRVGAVESAGTGARCSNSSTDLVLTRSRPNVTFPAKVTSAAIATGPGRHRRPFI